MNTKNLFQGLNHGPFNIILLLMAAIGMFHLRHDVKGPFKWIKIVLYIYSVLRMVFTTTNVCMIIPGVFEHTGRHRLLILISYIFYWKDLLNVVICFYVFENKNGFSSFVQYWRKIKNIGPFDKVIYSALFVSLVILSVPNLLFIPSFLQFFTDKSAYKGMFELYYYYIGYEHAGVTMQPYLILFVIFISLTDTFCILFFCGVCLIVHHEFSIFNERLEKNLRMFTKDTTYAVLSRQCKDSSNCLDTVSEDFQF